MEREYDIGDGRIDLFLKSKGKEKLCVAVEMKIDAGDQEKQLKRYDAYCRKCVWDGYRVLYLTLDGREATEKSVDGLEDERKIINVSFSEHIVSWLDMCVKVCENEGVDSSFIKQYEILVKKITKEDGMRNDIKELITGSEKVKACLAIADALEEVKYDISNEFFERLFHLLERTGNAIYWDYACVICKIRKIKVRDKEVLICMEVAIDDNSLIYNVTYRDSDEEIKIIDSNVFKDNNIKINAMVEKAIAEALNLKITANRYLGIKYFCVKSSENKIYNFNHFDETCAELADEDTMAREVKYIAGNVSNYIKDIGKALDEALGDRIC